MLISDDMGWDDYQHIPLLTAKIEAYANAATSNQIAEMLPNSEGKPVVIRLVYKHLPHAEILSVLNVIADQLSGIGIGFEHTVLPYDY